MIGAVCATATVGLRGFLLPSIRGRDLLQVAVLVNSLTIFILKSRTHLSIFCITINIVTKDYQNEDWVSVYQSALTELEDVKRSLEKLRSIGPTIKRLRDRVDLSHAV
jgi:hypothetical protein